MLFDKKNDETVEQKLQRLKKLRDNHKTVQCRIRELDTTEIATLTHDGNISAARWISNEYAIKSLRRYGQNTTD